MTRSLWSYLRDWLRSLRERLRDEDARWTCAVGACAGALTGAMLWMFALASGAVR